MFITTSTVYMLRYGTIVLLFPPPPPLPSPFPPNCARNYSMYANCELCNAWAAWVILSLARFFTQNKKNGGHLYHTLSRSFNN